MMEPSLYDYLSYQTEDFVMDDAFQQWVLQPDATSNQFWQQFLQSFPDKQEQIEEAREMVSNIRYQSHTLSKEKQESILQKVYAHAEKSAVESRQITFMHFNVKYMAIAATVILLIISALFFWLSFPSYDTYATGYKENKTIRLADGTEVSLNANTKLRVEIDVEANQPREVWLEGEAYFHVKRMAEQEIERMPALKNFIVHTDNFDIEVLGTTFNASSRARKSEVLLTSGKVKVASQQIEQTQILQPGDLLTLSEKDRNFHLKKTETEPEWRGNFFFFENTPLSEVARVIEDYYGLKVKIADQRLLEKIFTARISRDELPILLKALEASFDVKVSNEKGTISIQP
ncbi:FecR family protein [Catalinimonas niigatensis]|uniref:FecR family protein n=1 Tax=Catalinimonas niigatensis TaxID=1397264 RepID=UPI0026658333|nr:FecR domain-containing protein [Catalinimonas niigatensis]WPP51729.1 FecR domain-containing protein [Catalinimonas niigatensis]